jgi:hypothetical protein
MNLIVSPHPDDEIIGCSEVLKEGSIIIYDGDTLAARREEAMRLKDEIPTVQLFLRNIPSNLLNKEMTYYFPDPIHETHPLHRHWGMLGEGLARGKYDVVFYSVIMNVPYIHELSETDMKRKEELLDKIYPSQKSLWEREKKYILFEGRCKWMF